MRRYHINPVIAARTMIPTDVAKSMSSVLLEVDGTGEVGTEENGAGDESSAKDGGIMTVTVTVTVPLASVPVIVVVSPANAPTVSGLPIFWTSLGSTLGHKWTIWDFEG